MSYELLIMAFMLLVFCFFTITFVIRTIISVMNSVKPEEMDEIKPIDIIKMPEKKPKKSDYEVYLEQVKEKERRKYNTVMENLEAFDGTGNGQKEVE